MSEVSGSSGSSDGEAVGVEELLARLAERDAVLAKRDAVIVALTARVAELEARLGKNSRNSSKPPSSDNPFVKPPPRSLRGPAGSSGRRPGGQPGALGARLEPVAPEDVGQRVTHCPAACGGCGADLATAPVVGESVRQVLDVVPARVEVTEHRVEHRRCPCGLLAKAEFPPAASAPTCYGPGIRAAAAYLMGRQHLPVQRTAEVLFDLYRVRVSTGWLASVLPRAEAMLAGFATAVADRLAAAPVAHFDETGAVVADELMWVHVACTDQLTSYHLATGRGRNSADLGHVLPRFAGTAVHDALTSYRGYDVAHGLCGAHHLRELTGLAEATGQAWPTQLGELLVHMHRAAVAARTAGREYLPARQIAEFRARYRALIAQGWELNPPPPPTGKAGRPKLGPVGSLLRRFEKFEDDVLRFATDLEVPFDNNQAERDLRMIKLQQKISGSWRSQSGATAFLAVRSYLSTTRKQGHGALDVLTDAFTGNAWTPAPT